MNSSNKKNKVVFLSGMAFDANISIIKCLTEKYDVYFLALCNDGIFSRIGTFELSDDIVLASDVNEFSRLSNFLDLKKTYLLRHYSYKELGWKSITRKISLDLKVRNLISRLKPQAVICDLYNMFLTRFSFRKKIVLFTHDPFPHSGENNLKRKLTDYSMYKCTARYVLFNENQKTKFVNYFHINPNKVFTSFLSIYEMLSLYDCFEKNETSGRNILFWGRISKYKGINYLIDGFKKYIDSTGDKAAMLTIAGGGKWYFDVDSSVDGYPQITIIKRFLSMTELVHLIKESFIVVCPYTDATQSGVIMSAFALKKPVLATNVGGLPEMLNDGRTGMLIKPKDSNSICDAIQYLYTHPEKMAEYVNNIESIYFGDGEKSWRMGIKGICCAIESLPFTRE